MPDTTRSFSELHARIKKAGLLRKQPLYYDWVILRTLTLFLATIALVILVRKLTHSFLPQIPIAIGMGFVLVQIGLIMHDNGHRQLSTRFFPMVLIRHLGNLFLQTSATAWFVDHSAHHDNPNDAEKDPDCNINVFAFTKEEAQTKRGFYRLTAKYQTYLFIPLSLFSLTSMRITSTLHILKGKVPQGSLELLMCGIGALLYGATILYILGYSGLLFMLITECTAGLYMGLAFITNHRGRIDFTKQTVDDFLIRQVETSRNLNSSCKFLDAAIHFVYGGLNCQIEHHLWPYMPRPNLKKAREIVREYCTQHAIDYHSVSFLRGYREIFSHFDRISKYVP